MDRAVSTGFSVMEGSSSEKRGGSPVMCKSRCQWCDKARRVSLAVAGQFGNVVAGRFRYPLILFAGNCNVLVRRFRRNTSRVTAGPQKQNLFVAAAGHRVIVFCCWLRRLVFGAAAGDAANCGRTAGKRRTEAHTGTRAGLCP